MSTTGWVVLGIIVVLVIWAISIYNSLVAMRQRTNQAFADIDVQLKQRHDLIPNLVETVKGYAAHEREVLERVVELRNRCAAQASTGTANQADEQQLVAGLQRLFAIVENYPQLKADQHFLRLQEELVNTEDRIQAARRFYNGNVRDYRNKCEQFPSSIVAGMFNFKPADYFDVEPAVRQTVPEARF